MTMCPFDSSSQEIGPVQPSVLGPSSGSPEPSAPVADRRRVLGLVRRLGSPEGRLDPTPVLETMRGLGPTVPTPWGAILVTGYDDCRAILNDPGWRTIDQPWRLENTGVRAHRPSFAYTADTAIGSNPPVHGPLRSHYAAIVSPRIVGTLGDIIERLVEEHLTALDTALEQDGSADFAQLVSDRLPMAVAATLLGLPREDVDLLRDASHALAWSMDLSPSGAKLAQADDAARLLTAYLGQLAAARRRIDVDSPLLAWLGSDDELVRRTSYHQTGLFLVAAHETTGSLLGDGLLHLWREPGHAPALTAEPAAVVDELLRLVSPAQLVTRFATEDLVLPSGAAVPSGQVVHPVLAAANRDPAVFPDPHTMDPSRTARRSLAFGIGPHYCVGAPLARREGTALLSALGRRYDLAGEGDGRPVLELAGDPVYLDNLAFRGVEHLPVRVRAVRRRTQPIRTTRTIPTARRPRDGATAPAPPVRTARDGAVLTVTLDRPDTGNRLDSALLDALADVVHGLPDEVRAVVLHGTGDHFCTGGDLDEFAARAQESPRALRGMRDALAGLLDAVRACDRVTVAALHGSTVGAGLGLALACDLRVAADDAVVRLPETLLGVPVGSGTMLDRLVAEAGASRARHLLLLGDALTAPDALASGLLHAVVPPGDVLAVAHRLARRTTRRDRDAVRVTKLALARLPHEPQVDDTAAFEAALLRRSVRAGS